jgi:hypothetical protein
VRPKRVKVRGVCWVIVFEFVGMVGPACGRSA